MKIPFRNKKGQVIKLDEKLTLAALTRLGASVSLVARGKPAPASAYVHDPKAEDKPK